MPVPAPNLTFTVTPPGGSPIDYSNRLAWAGAGQLPAITQNFGRQGDTATFPLVDEYVTTPHFSIPMYSQVKFVDVTLGLTLFAGVVNHPHLAVDGPGSSEWQLQCTDYTFYADNAVVQGTFTGQTVDQIVVALTKLANCGITADTVANGGFVSPGPQLASFVTNYTTLSAVWRKLATLAGQFVPFGWYVDENLALHFFDATTATNTGVTFTTAVTTEGSTTEGHIQSSGGFGYEWDGASVRNRILVQGANQTINYGDTNHPPTDTWVGNGVQNSWPLRYTFTGTPVLHVGGLNTAASVVMTGATGTGSWQIIQNNAGAWFLTNTDVGGVNEGVVIKIWYNYQVPVVAVVNDLGSQAVYTGPNRGVYTEYINDTSLTTVPMALNRAMRERTEYSFAAERVNFSTSEEWVGWIRAGQLFTMVNQFVPDAQNNFSMGINDIFIVTSNSIAFTPGGYRQATITAIRL